MMDMMQGDAEQPDIEQEVEHKVSIQKLPDGSYQVEMASHEGMEGMAEEPQTFPSAQEACQAAIAMLDGGGNAEAEIMDGYNGPRGQMKKVGVKEVFGGWA